MEPAAITLRRAKLPFLGLGLLLALASGLVYVLRLDVEGIPFVTGAAILGGMAALLWVFILLMPNRALLRLDVHGIVGDPDRREPLVIPWENVAGVLFRQMHHAQYICISVNDRYRLDHPGLAAFNKLVIGADLSLPLFGIVPGAAEIKAFVTSVRPEAWKS